MTTKRFLCFVVIARLGDEQIASICQTMERMSGIEFVGKQIENQSFSGVEFVTRERVVCGELRFFKLKSFIDGIQHAVTYGI